MPTLVQLDNFPAYADAGGREVPGVRRPHARAARPPTRHDPAAAYEAGVPIYAGTDAGGVLPHGAASADEVLALHGATGFEPADALGAASWRGARLARPRRHAGRGHVRRLRRRPPRPAGRPARAARSPRGSCCAARSWPEPGTCLIFAGRVNVAECTPSPVPVGPSQPSRSRPLELATRRPHRRSWPLTHTREPRRHHTRGRQDQSEAHGQDPCAVLPHRRRRLAHQARRPGHRGDRQVPPQAGALADRGQLRAGAVLARRRRAADRARRGDPQDHRRLAEVQGPAGHRGHPAGGRAQAATRPSSSTRRSRTPPASRRPGRPPGRRRAAKKAAPADEAPVAPPAEEKPAAETPAAEAPAAEAPAAEAPAAEAPAAEAPAAEETPAADSEADTEKAEG